MPNRILREWTDSESVNLLSAEAERFFVRVIQKADDFGRYNADPKLLRPYLFPLLLDSTREVSLERWIAECVKARLVRRYVVGGKPYLVIEKFGQRVRADVSKFPPPPGESQTNDGHVTVTCQSGDGPPRPESESESESESETETIPPLPSVAAPQGGPPSRGAPRRFIPPTLDEVRAEVASRSLPVDAEAFLAHYQTNGWVQGRGKPVRDWKACLTTWAKNEPKFRANGNGNGDKPRNGTPILAVGARSPGAPEPDPAAIEAARLAYEDREKELP